jgi:arginine N-succinyltransferase
MNTLLVRDACEADLPALQALTRTPGLALAQQPHEHLLVAQDLGSARLIACARLRPAIGLALPRHWYHVGCTVHAAAELALFHRQRTLLLGNDHTGASELCHLATAADGVPMADQAAALRLVLQSALLRMAGRRSHYAPQLIAELPGLRDAAGHSPFWLGLGRHFYSGDTAAAAQRLGEAWRSHVAALLPRQAVYASFLPEPAQAAIAQVRHDALLQREVLEACGLHYGHHVTIDDAGPVLQADVDMLASVNQARSWTLAAGRDDDAVPTLVLADGGPAGLRATRVMATGRGGRLQVAPEACTRLQVTAGDVVWALPLQSAG